MKKTDLILIISIIFLAVKKLFIYKAKKTTASYIVISVDGNEYRRAFLNKDELIILNRSGGYNAVKIENGYAYMYEASCPDQICVNHAPIKMGTETIICLPNRVVIEAKENNNTIDAINY